MGGFAIGTTEFVSMGLLPQLARGVEVSIPAAGHAISAYALGVVVGAPTIAFLAARLPRRALLVALMTAFAVGNAASALATSYGALLVARFAAGLPHGAYFGVASLVAASLVRADRKGRAVASVMLGLSVANVVGVPAATWLGQNLGWRTAYWLVALLGLVTVALVLAFVPCSRGDSDATWKRELAALPPAAGAADAGRGRDRLRRHVRGLHLHRPHDHRGRRALGVGRAALPAGLRPRHGRRHLGGRPDGRLVGDALDVHRRRRPGPAAAPVQRAGARPAGGRCPWSSASPSTGSVLVVALQLRLMAVAEEAQTMGAAMNHAALNVANALGAWLGGLVIAAGWGYRAPAIVGAALAGLGLLVLAWSASLRRRHG